MPAVARARQREAKRQAVLQTAARLFNERGFHATSLDDIAERLHVSKPTLYWSCPRIPGHVLFAM